MNTRIFRFLSPVHFYSPSPLSPLRVSLLLIHSVAGGAALPRKPEPPPRLPRAFYPTHSFSSSSKKHHEEDGRDVKVAVWWDFENCSIPAGVNVFQVAQRITSALRSNGIKGPVTITAFGDVLQLARTSQEALTSTGICLNHVPRGGKNSSDRSFMADLVYWISQNPPPVHFFLISGDKDFANILHRLRMSNYNILLASRESTPGVLCSAATIMWSWTCLVKGNNATAKHFNHPPDGFYGSWYGHHKIVLDDPFSEMEQANGKGEEYVELSSESKPRPIPKAFVNAIRQILHSYPEGINMSDLRNELKRINVTVDKDFFGYKKFFHLLTSMPNILKFIPSTSLEGQPLVVGRHTRTADSSPVQSKTTQDFDHSVGETSHTPKQDGKPLSVVTPNNDVGHTPLTPKSPANQEEIDSDNNKMSSHTHRQYGVNEGGIFQNFKRYFFKFQQLKEPSSLSTKENNAEANHDVSTSKQRKNIVESGFLQRIRGLMNHPSTDLPAGRIASISGLDSTSNKDSGEAEPTRNVIEKLKCEDKKTNWKNKLSPSKNFREVGESPASDKTTCHSDVQTVHPETKQSFFKRIARWWSKKSEKDQEAVFEPGKEVINKCNIVNPTPSLDVFSKGYFWDALESFLLTSKGAELISKSRTREQVVHGLQKEGPWVLKDLSKAQLLDLVNLMIVEKKWIKVSIFQTFPFKLTFDEQKCVTSHSYNSNGLSSLFTAKISKTSKQRQPEQETLDRKSGLMGSSFTETTATNQPQNFVEFKAWLQKAYKSKDLQPEDLEKMFESIFSIKLVPSSYGYPDLQSLIAACLSDDNHKKTKSSPSREKLLYDCRKLLIELFDEYPDGFNMSAFKPAFLQKYGYVLDFQTLGYLKLASLLEIMPGVRIESSFVIPAERFLSDSSFTNQPTQDDKVNASNNTDRETTADDCAWEELGPVNETVTCGDLTAAPIKDKEVTYDEASLSDDEFSDPEEGNTPQLQDPEGKSGRCREESSLIQILDSWYGSQEGGEKSQAQGSKGGNHNEQASANQEGGQKESSKDGCETEQVGAADVLVDCSKVKPKIMNDVKPKLRFHKRYSFVSDSKDDKEKLVDSILGSLKKAGNSKLIS